MAPARSAPYLLISKCRMWSDTGRSAAAGLSGTQLVNLAAVEKLSERFNCVALVSAAQGREIRTTLLQITTLELFSSLLALKNLAYYFASDMFMLSCADFVDRPKQRLTLLKWT